MNSMERVVQQIQPSDEQAKNTKKPFSEYVDIKGLVLLGAPGAGKTHLLKEAAKPEGCYYLTAKSFLNRPVSKLNQYDCLFIDALDEQRASAGTQDVLSQVVKKLWEVQPQKVRLACRIADWHGDLDLDTLNDYLCDDGGQKATVAQLEPLTEQDVLAILSECEISEPDAFLETAKTRGLAELLGNPQTLKMLATVVSSKQWPTTKKELFEQASDLLLTETSGEHLRSALVGNAAERLDCAGAICAARLIADVEGVYLSATESHLSHENWLVSGEIHLFKHDLIESVLRSRLFSANSEQEFDYSHRMVAEHLAARWSAKQIQNGLPLNRFMAVISVDGLPVSELRSLYTWLALYLPEEFNYLVHNDAQTILLYGDIASFNTTQKKQLLHELGLLADENPYFISGHWWSLDVGSLACPELTDTIKTLLTSESTSLHLKAVLYLALKKGQTLPETRQLLKGIILSNPCCSEANEALDAYLKQVGGCKDEIGDTFRSLGESHEELMIKARILRLSPQGTLTNIDIVKLLTDAINSNGNESTGGYFWELHKLVNIKAIPEILNSIINNTAIPDEFPIGFGIARDAFSVTYKLLNKLITEQGNIDAPSLWRWLEFLYRKVGYEKISDDELTASLKKIKPKLIKGLTPIYLKHYCFESSVASTSPFNEIMLNGLTEQDLLVEVLTKLKFSNKEQLPNLYKLCLELSLKADAYYHFWQLYNQAEGDCELSNIRNDVCFHNLEHRFAYRLKSAKRKKDKEHNQKQGAIERQKSFLENQDAIQDASHHGWLIEIARHYYSHYQDDDNKASPRSRLIDVFGENGADIAIQGLINCVSKQPFIDLEDAYKNYPTTTLYPSSWLPILAGINESMRFNKSISKFNNDFLLRAIQANIIIRPNRHDNEHKCLLSSPWITLLLQSNPALVSNAICKLEEYRFSKKHSQWSSEIDLYNLSELNPYKLEYIKLCLSNCIKYEIPPTIHLLSYALGNLDKNTLIEFTSSALECKQKEKTTTYLPWLSLKFILSEQCNELLQLDELNARTMVWLMRDCFHKKIYIEALRGQHSYIAKLQRLIVFVAKFFPARTQMPTGETITGNSHNWDATEFLLSLVNSIATITTLGATICLQELIEAPELKSYQNDIKHKLFEQRALYVNASFKPPAVQQALNVLENKAPANIVDLQALIMDTMHDIQRHISGSNEDAYRAFWNEPKGKPSTPKWEESCRDALLPLLRHNLEKFGIHVEPEGHMVKDKRADIVIFHEDLKMVIELKRDFHTELWSAASTQLDRLYTRDPNAQGYGIYGVFWYGDKRTNQIKKHPGGLEKPNTPQQLCEMLVNRLTDEQKNRIAVFVLDVSEPSD